MTQTAGSFPSGVDIEVYAGEPLDFTVPVRDAANALVDVTGWTGVAQVRRYPGGPLLHTLTLALSSSGVRVTASGAVTAAWAAWRHPVARWDVWVTPPAEDSRPLAAGRVLVRSPLSEVSS